MTRLCDLAVECSRSMASMAICTAVSKPKVRSVPESSLSMFLGTHHVDAQAVQLGGHAQRVLAADGHHRAHVEVLEVLLHRLRPALLLEGLVRLVPRMVPL